MKLVHKKIKERRSYEAAERELKERAEKGPSEKESYRESSVERTQERVQERVQERAEIELREGCERAERGLRRVD